MTPRRRPGTAALLIVLGVGLLQAAWIWSLAPFGSIDEIDHAYRAASVGQGHLVDRAPVHRGRGDVISVPRDIVAAAHHRCLRLRYVGRDNCFPTSAAAGSGDVRIASAAARYNPVYYALVGIASRPFQGVAALYVMRAVTALLSDVFVALALWIALRHGEGPWPLVGVLVAGTPVLLCASATAAPNGVGMAASVAFWAASAALLRGRVRIADEATLFAIAAGACAAVVVTHSTGPVWMALSVGALALAAGRTRLGDLWRRHRCSVGSSAAFAVGTTAFSLLWIVSQRTNDPTAERTVNAPMPWGQLLAQPFVWALQTIGAAPFRDQAGPSVVFVIGLLEFAFVMLVGIRHAPSAVRAIMAMLAAVSLLLPMVATVLTYHRLGFAWQGRYELPLGFGLLILAAWSTPARFGRHLRAAIPALTVAAMAIMNAATLVNLRHLMHWSPQDGGSPPTVQGLILLCVGMVVLAGSGLTVAANAGRLSTPSVDRAEAYA